MIRQEEVNLVGAARVLMGHARLDGTELEDIPLNVAAYAVLRPRLSALIAAYGIETQVLARNAKMLSHADELELFLHSNRVFQTRFAAQVVASAPEQPPAEGASSDTGRRLREAARSRLRGPGAVFLVRASWLEARTVFPVRDPKQQNQTALLDRFKEVGCGLDALLKAEADFTLQGDLEFTMLALKNRAEATRKPPNLKSTVVSSHPKGERRSNEIWAGAYTAPNIEIPERETENDTNMSATGGGGSEAGGSTVGASTEKDEGGRTTGKFNTQKDALLAYA